MPQSEYNLASSSSSPAFEVRRLLARSCGCHACEPFYELRALPPDPAFVDLPSSGREACDAERKKGRRALELSADAQRHLPRVMDLPPDIDMAALPGRLANDGFHPSCPQYREVVALLADGSFENEVAQSRIGHFDRKQAAASKKRPKKGASKPRRVKAMTSLLSPEDLRIPQEQIEADRAHRARMAQPDPVAAARGAAQRRVGEQIAAVMLGTDAPETDET